MQQSEVGETTKRASIENRVELSPGIRQEPPNDHASASGDDSSVVRNPTDARREGCAGQAVSGATQNRDSGERQTSRGDQTRARFAMYTSRFRSLKNDYDRLANEHESLYSRHCQLSGTHRAAVTKLHETRTFCREQELEINDLRGKLRRNSALLEVRNQEAKVANVFLSKEDPFSTSDVVQSVRDLNSEIMQTAAHLAENLPLKRVCAPLAEEMPEGHHKSIFVTLVLPQGAGEEVDVGSLELALQGSLAFYACGIANTWDFSSTSRWYDKIYSKVCETGTLILQLPVRAYLIDPPPEDRTVASNWRALTRRTLGHMGSSHEDLRLQTVNNMINRLAKLLSSCGVGNTADNVNNIHTCAAEKFGELFTMARKLNKIIGENVVSEDLTVTIIRKGIMFDGENMEDAHARAGVRSAGRSVICTTDLGLLSKWGANGARKVLLKPKVALHDG